MNTLIQECHEIIINNIMQGFDEMLKQIDNEFKKIHIKFIIDD